MKKFMMYLMAFFMFFNLFGCAWKLDNNGISVWGAPAKDGRIYAENNEAPTDVPWGFSAKSPSYVIKGHLDAGATFEAGMKIVSDAVGEIFKLPVFSLLNPIASG